MQSARALRHWESRHFNQAWAKKDGPKSGPDAVGTHAYREMQTSRHYTLAAHRHQLRALGVSRLDPNRGVGPGRLRGTMSTRIAEGSSSVLLVRQEHG